MNKEEHKARHVELHKALDELIADFIRCNEPPPGGYLGMSVRELVDWSYKQTLEPDDPTAS